MSNSIIHFQTFPDYRQWRHPHRISEQYTTMRHNILVNKDILSLFKRKLSQIKWRLSVLKISQGRMRNITIAMLFIKWCVSPKGKNVCRINVFYCIFKKFIPFLFRIAFFIFTIQRVSIKVIIFLSTLNFKG